MKKLIIAGLSAFILTIILTKIFLPLLKKIKAGQTVLNYVKEHKDKNGTPTMGGLFFILSASIVCFILGSSRIQTVCITIGLAFMVVGFIDDFIKIRFKKNDGLKPYQKIIFQLAISIFAGLFAYQNQITIFHLPFSQKTINLGIATIPLVAVIFIAITNCVNLTDGLDGLAGSTSCVYLLITAVLIGLQMEKFGYIYLRTNEYFGLQTLSISLVGALLGFLIFNVNKASVFMGDTGSLSLGGFIGAISIFSLNSFFIPLIGIMFVVSGISVIVQVAHFKRTKKRVFLMAPLHHHFQLKGYSESKISFCYALITILAGAVAVLNYI